MHFLFQITFFEDGAPSRKLPVRPWKRMVGRLIFFWEGLFSGALLNLGRANSAIFLLEPLSFPPTLLVNECGNGCPPQQELKQISNFQPAVFVSRIYTNINPVSLPLILPCGVPRLSWCQPWWGISKVWLEESQLHPVIIRYIYTWNSYTVYPYLYDPVYSGIDDFINHFGCVKIQRYAGGHGFVSEWSPWINWQPFWEDSPIRSNMWKECLMLPYFSGTLTEIKLQLLSVWFKLS